MNPRCVPCFGLSVLLAACTSLSHERSDAGYDAPTPGGGASVFAHVADAETYVADAETYVAHDAELVADADAASDASLDAQPDAASDASLDAQPDAASDASLDAQPDPVSDASLDAQPDAADALDASAPETCAVGSFPTASGCEAFPVSTISVNYARCRVRPDHTLWCWGLPSSSSTWQEPRVETQVGSDADWTSISVGGQQMCGIRAPGSLWCFGVLNLMGTVTYQNTPLRIGSDSDWLQVSAASASSCGIKQDGTLWCWGSLLALNPGVSTFFSAEPVQVGSDSDWSYVATMGNYACAIRTNGSLECFGDNHYGRLGDGTTVNHAAPAPIAVTGPWRSVAVGSRPCAVRYDGTLWCWGNYACSSCTSGELAPQRVGAVSDWTSIAMSNYAGPCGLRSTGQLLCTDRQNNGALSEPVPLDSELGYTKVAAGCAEHQDGTLRCWGYPLLGDGVGNIEPVPIRVGTRTDWKDLALAGAVLSFYTDGSVDVRGAPPLVGKWIEAAVSTGNSACAIRDDHTLWCHRLAGDAAQTWKQELPASSDFLHVVMGTGNKVWACAIREGATPGQGTLWCAQPGFDPNWRQASADTDWVKLSSSFRPCGIHADGRLTCWDVKTVAGGPLFTWTAQFTDIGSDHDWVKVSASTTKCAIKTDGSLWCWGGSNQWGQTGNGTHTPATNPMHIAPGTHWKDVLSNDLYTCGVQTDGSLWCWGYGSYGQLGVGLPGAQRLVPTRVGTATDWELVRGNQAVCGIRKGELWCWGDNTSGYVTWQSRYVATPRIVDESAAPGGGQYCPVPIDSDMDGYAACLGDCDDKNVDVNPFASESCNGVDDDCDGVNDEGCP